METKCCGPSSVLRTLMRQFCAEYRYRHSVLGYRRSATWLFCRDLTMLKWERLLRSRGRLLFLNRSNGCFDLRIARASAEMHVEGFVNVRVYLLSDCVPAMPHFEARYPVCNIHIGLRRALQMPIEVWPQIWDPEIPEGFGWIGHFRRHLEGATEFWFATDHDGAATAKTL